MPRRPGPALFARNRCAGKGKRGGRRACVHEAGFRFFWRLRLQAIEHPWIVVAWLCFPIDECAGAGSWLSAPRQLPLKANWNIDRAGQARRTRTPGGVLARLTAGFNRGGRGPEADASYPAVVATGFAGMLLASFGPWAAFRSGMADDLSSDLCKLDRRYSRYWRNIGLPTRCVQCLQSGKELLHGGGKEKRG